MTNKKVTVIGAGLAGCEAAWSLAQNGIYVDLIEMKPIKYSPAHKYSGFAELVCSNSLKASRIDSAAGLLKEEMRRLGSLTVPTAELTSVAAGGALAVNRTDFSDIITKKIHANKLINVISKEQLTIPKGYVIIATGPLTDGEFAQSIKGKCGDYLSFYDAAAPIVSFDSLDKSLVFFASRYGRGDDDYINCPLNQDEYQSFYQSLISAESVQLKDFETDGFKVYEGCMPIEVLGKRGEDTMRFGPLKPVGLTDPRTGKRPYAVVQLRREDAEGTMYNLVGFQTNLKFGEQKRVFSKITGLQNAEFIRFGVMHRNSFLDSPRLLDSTFRMRNNPEIYFAGQITGVEGYMESAASGIIAGLNLANVILDKTPLIMPKETMIGALSNYISDPRIINFQPMGSNMGILPELDEHIRDKKLKYEKLAERSLASFQSQIDIT